MQVVSVEVVLVRVDVGRSSEEGSSFDSIAVSDNFSRLI